MEKLKFYDLRGRKKFMSDKYKIVVKKGRKFAVCKAPSGAESWRIVGMAKKKKAA
jgi:hypothetical protein